LVKLLGGRGASAVMGLFMLALASSEAGAQSARALTVPAAIKTLDVNMSARPLGSAVRAVTVPVVASATAITTGSGLVLQGRPATNLTVQLKPSIAQEASWLRQAGWSLGALVDRYSSGEPLDYEANWLAKAVYFEARGETLEGQLAVARVVMNRAASGKYPTSWSGVITQPWQFSFVRNGRSPAVDEASDAWRKAQAITRIAMANAVPSVGTDVLWYHANYVAPSWGRHLNRVEKIGAHIFYRA
jgi:N-acetylmuramoyl-L-alanine amidase